MGSIIHHWYSASHAGLKRWREASEDAKECIKLNPQFVKGYYRLATALLELEEYDLAQSTIKQGLALDANNAPLLKVLRSIKQQKKAAATAAAGIPTSATGMMASNPTANMNMTNGGGGTILGGLDGSKQHLLDAATSREYQDLRMQHATTMKEYQTLQATMQKSTREIQFQQVTQQELTDHPTNGSYYRSIGKIFFKSTRERVLEGLQSNIAEQSKKQTDMTQKLEYLERRIKSQEQNMQELLSNAE